MTALVEQSEAAAPFFPPRPPSRFARWWSGWRVALRLARRDALRNKGRSLLVLLLIALPVAGVTAVDVYARAERAAHTDTAYALNRLGATADALVTLIPSSPVTQSPVGWLGETDAKGPAATEARVLAALPAGSRLAQVGAQTQVALEAGEWGVSGTLRIQDTRDPLVAGLWRVRSGRLPAAAGEAAITSLSADRLHVGVGSEVVLTPLTKGGDPVRVTVVGIAEDSGDVTGAVVLPGVVPAPGGAPDDTRLAAIPRALSWPDVRALNAVGAVVVSRTVVTDPPMFCGLTDICLDDRPTTTPAPNPDELARAADLAARYAAVVGVVTVLVVLQIALLAGPAFAVQLRRRQRELGLIGASGGDALSLRRTVLASGVVLGVAGAALGVAGGWASIWLLLSGALPWQPLPRTGSPLGMPPLPPEVLGIAAVGVVAAIAASLVPAEVAGRGDVIDTLKGRRPLPPVRTRVPLLGLLLGGVGLIAMAYGTHILEPVILGLGVATAELGLVLVMPFLVSRGALIARWLPLSPRLAVRDAGRHRMRTTAAACAIAAAAAGAVAVASWSQSLLLQTQASDVTYLDGAVLLVAGNIYDDNGNVVTPASQQVGPMRAVIASTLPAATSASLTDLTSVNRNGTSGGDYGFVSCVSAAAAASAPALSTSEADGQCVGRRTTGSRFGQSVVELDDPAQLAAVLGPLAPLEEARAALEAGKALVLQPGAVDAQGQVALRASTYDPTSGVEDPAPLLRVPALEVLTGAVPADVIVGPAALAAGAPLSGHVVPSPTSTMFVVIPAEPDTAEHPTAQDRVTLAMIKLGLEPGYFLPPNDDVPGVLILAAGAAATALLALLAGLMVTGLALADGRADLVTLAAVGAPPGARRRIAASSAGFVSLLGCVVGAGSGLLAARVLVPLVTQAQGGVFVVPWLMLGLVVLAVPLLTAGVAWLTTRSRVVLVRRMED